MNTELILDGAYKIPKAKIYAAEMDAEVRRAVALLEGGGKLVLEREGTLYPVAAEEAECFYTSGGRVEARLKNGEVFSCRERIFEREEKLGRNFVKVNQGAVANLDCVKCFSLLFNGTMEVCFFSGAKEYVSRRTVGKIKKILGIGGKRHD